MSANTGKKKNFFFKSYISPCYFFFRYNAKSGFVVINYSNICNENYIKSTQKGVVKHLN